jgi:hypothetical protein
MQDWDGKAYEATSYRKKARKLAPMALAALLGSGLPSFTLGLMCRHRAQS